MRLLEKRQERAIVHAHQMLFQLENIISSFLESITFIDMSPDCKGIHNFYIHEIVK